MLALFHSPSPYSGGLLSSPQIRPAVAHTLGILAAAISLAVLLGRLLAHPFLAFWIPSILPMAIPSALAFLLTSAAVILQVRPDSRTIALSRWLALASLITLACFPPRHPWSINAYGTPAPAAAFTLVLLNCALLTLASNVWLAQWLASGAILVGCVAALGYLFDVKALSDISSFAAMPLPAVVAVLLLGAALLALRADAGLMHVLTHPGPSRILAQRFLPFAVLSFLGVHWIGRVGFQYGLYSDAFQTLLVTIAGIVVIVALTWRAIYQIQLAETDRSRAILRFQAAASAAQALIYEWDAETGHVDRICGLQELTGYDASSVPPDSHWWNSLVHPKDQDHLHAVWSQPRRTGETVTLDYRVRSRSGAYIHVLDSFLVLETRHGSPRRVIGSTIDITERKRKEEELRSSNEDLRQFAYAAAHDLQEPLRMVSVFTQMLHNGWRDRLDATTQTWMNFVIEGTQRMHSLLTDLRVYTEMANISPSGPVLCDANHALNIAIHNLQPLIEDSGARISSSTLPSDLRCREDYLVQLFQNLLSNSIKYRSAEPPQVHIDVTTGPGEWLFSVQDNGIGIDPQYASQIFGIFKRLSRKVPGTGMGLAICARVVERCGGRIWVESQVGQGATFNFTLPFH
jgi:PAS domain S-box-containing protein